MKKSVDPIVTLLLLLLASIGGGVCSSALALEQKALVSLFCAGLIGSVLLSQVVAPEEDAEAL